MENRSESLVCAQSRLRTSWERADALFERDVGENAALCQPISLRRPFVFYLGHLPAFARRVIDRLGCAGAKCVHDYDVIFERGIDPDVEDPSLCHKHPTPPPSWPDWKAVLAYRDCVRAEVCSLSLPAAAVHLIAEHDLMHVETLNYMLAQRKLPWKTKNQVNILLHSDNSNYAISADAIVASLHESFEWLSVPSGTARLGLRKSDEVSDGLGERNFAWDNEFPRIFVDVAPFHVTKNPVTIGQYLRFIHAGGYKNREYWLAHDWEWIIREGIQYPASLRCVSASNDKNSNNCWAVVTVDGVVRVADSVLAWPISVSTAEARAFARFAKARLLTEAEWDRVAFKDTESGDSEMPWGGTSTVPGVHGNFGLWSRRPLPVGGFPDGRSWTGALDLYGNGWELVDTVFEPFRDFSPMRLYKEYSADFFDGKHFVLKGASWATDASLLRRSFRNFYQAHYPFVFSKFRLARSA